MAKYGRHSCANYLYECLYRTLGILWVSTVSSTVVITNCSDGLPQPLRHALQGPRCRWLGGPSSTWQRTGTPPVPQQPASARLSGRRLGGVSLVILVPMTIYNLLEFCSCGGVDLACVLVALNTLNNRLGWTVWSSYVCQWRHGGGGSDHPRVATR
jgi:hypothetical protein